MAVSVADTVGAITRVKRGRTKIIIVTPEGAFPGDVNRHAQALNRYNGGVVLLRPEPAI